MNEIKLTQGKVTLVDDEDFGSLNSHKWYFGGGYVVRNVRDSDGTRSKWPMHWEVIGKPQKGKETDHINCNKLDNRKENLRIVTRSQNRMNVGKYKNNTSGFKGVSMVKDSGKWQAHILVRGKNMKLGYFLTKELAYRAYCDTCIKYHKEYGRVA